MIDFMKNLKVTPDGQWGTLLWPSTVRFPALMSRA